MAHILFIEANVAALDAMRRAKELGHTVSFVRSAEFRFYPEDADTAALFELLDRRMDIGSTADPDVLERALKSFVDVDPPDAVISQIEFSVEATAVVCNRLGLPFTNVDAVCNARNKATARRLVAQARLPTPRARAVMTADDAVEAAAEFGFPVVLKPVSGANSMLACRADDAAEMLLAATQAFASMTSLPEMIREQFGRGMVVEEHLSGELVSAEVGALNGRFYRFMVSGRPRARENECLELGAFMPADLSVRQRKACFDYAERVCQALGLDLGIFHIEMIFTSDGPRLVEANPRLMGGIMPLLYKLNTGKDIHDYEIAIHLRREISEPLPPPRDYFFTARTPMPRNAGRVADHVDLTWLNDYRDSILAYFPAKVEPGVAVGEHEILVRYVVGDRDLLRATELADRLVDRFEESLGVELVR